MPVVSRIKFFFLAILNSISDTLAAEVQPVNSAIFVTFCFVCWQYLCYRHRVSVLNNVLFQGRLLQKRINIKLLLVIYSRHIKLINYKVAQKSENTLLNGVTKLSNTVNPLNWLP